MRTTGMMSGMAKVVKFSVARPARAMLRLYAGMLLGVLLCVGGCEQQAASPQAEAVPTAPALVYRPQVKLATTDPDPAVLKEFLAARALLYEEKFAEARARLLPLAEAGYTDAQLDMADSYMPHDIMNLKTPVDYDWERGIPWLIRAADGGNARAQWLAGDWYYHGAPGGQVRRDYDAIQWDKVYHYLRAAAEQGLAVGQSELAGLYSGQHGVAREDRDNTNARIDAAVRAYMYYTLASQRIAAHDGVGIDSKQLKLGLRARVVEVHQLTPAQIAEGERLVQEWIRTHPDAYQVEDPPELYPD